MLSVQRILAFRQRYVGREIDPRAACGPYLPHVVRLLEAIHELPSAGRTHNHSQLRAPLSRRSSADQSVKLTAPEVRALYNKNCAESCGSAASTSSSPRISVGEVQNQYIERIDRAVIQEHRLSCHHDCGLDQLGRKMPITNRGF